MALPKLLQKLFADEGKGPKLNPSIIPTKINGQEPDETGEFNLQLSDPDAATRPEILTAVKKVTEASEVTFEPEESLPSVGHNIGEEWVSYTGVIPFGGIPYCGQEVTRETYRDLWEYVQTQGLVKSESEWQSLASSQNGNVAFYSDGDGSTTFRMPQIVGYVKGASSQSEAGTHLFEGLPNITGTGVGIIPNTSSLLTDALVWGDLANDGKTDLFDFASSGGWGQARRYSFNASKSNAIYGNGDHVTPETSVVMFGVYAFGEITNQGALDAETLANGLATLESNVATLESNVATLENTKLENSTPHVIESWSNGKSWYRVWSDGWCEQGGFVTKGNQTITLFKAMKDTNYTILMTNKVSSGERWEAGVNNAVSITTTSFGLTSQKSESYHGMWWQVSGYCA